MLPSKNRLAVALDYPDADQAMKLVDALGQTCQWFKVGMELYYAAGNIIIHQLRDRGFDVFLDLKLHDIPNTVAGAVRSATHAGAGLLTIHASGGAAMMAAAAEAGKAPGSPRLLAVTVLTSMPTNSQAQASPHPPPTRSSASPNSPPNPASTASSALRKRSPPSAQPPVPTLFSSSQESVPQEQTSATRSVSLLQLKLSPAEPPCWS
jgi:hypothetical protein